MFLLEQLDKHKLMFIEMGKAKEIWGKEIKTFIIC